MNLGDSEWHINQIHTVLEQSRGQQGRKEASNVRVTWTQNVAKCGKICVGLQNKKKKKKNDTKLSSVKNLWKEWKTENRSCREAKSQMKKAKFIPGKGWAVTHLSGVTCALFSPARVYTEDGNNYTLRPRHRVGRPSHQLRAYQRWGATSSSKQGLHLRQPPLSLLAWQFPGWGR